MGGLEIVEWPRKNGWPRKRLVAKKMGGQEIDEWSRKDGWPRERWIAKKIWVAKR
jgi:hypothetical protein